MSEQRTWIKNPLAVFTANSLDARGGIVTEGQKIAELLTAGQPPSQPAPVSVIVRCRICGWRPVCARRGIWRPLACRLVWALTVRRRMMHQT